MSDCTPFILRFPRIIQVDDEIVVKGKLSDNAREFTFNLCVDSATNPKIYPPEYIAFHFRTNFDQTGGSYVVLNYKKGENNWGPEEIKENTWIDDLEPFELTIRFSETEIKVYTEEDGSNFQFEFPYRFDLKYISNLQMGGDVDHISELTLRFGNKK